MKDTIKIIIALAFILGSYFVGSYFANEKSKEKLDNLQQQITNQEKNLVAKNDSLTLIQKQLMDCSSMKDDTLKVQFINSPTKKKK